MIFAFDGGLRELIPHCTISRVRLQRVNCNLRAALKIFHHRSQQKWDEDLHLLAFAFNTAYESTKFCHGCFLGES
jgi:hypothetical protein